jgi:hypothetical protein
MLYQLQFGFREQHSTYLALITLMEKIITALEKGHFTIGIFLDFSKDFDTVNHHILLEKLKCYGIRGTANSWIHSYLQDRQQYTLYNEKKILHFQNYLWGTPGLHFRTNFVFDLY